MAEHLRVGVNIEDINRKSSENVYKLIDRGEEAYINQVKEIANQVSIYNKKIVLITGPSSAGKTTSSYKLKQELKNIGINSYVLNMDDFFNDLDKVPLREDGKPDMEGLVALDVDCVKNCLQDILLKGEARTPTFDFATHKRTDVWHSCKVKRNEVIIMEGIHALNPVITQGLDADKIYKVYVHCNTDFVMSGKIIFHARQLRLLRRMVRDERERHTPLTKTLELWDDVCAGEDKNIRPYKSTANYFLNSTHFYEPLLYKSLLIQPFQKLKKIPEIKQFLQKFRLCATIEESFIPKDSLIREFIGK